MNVKAKVVIGSIGVLGFFAYKKLSYYLKHSKVETFNFLRAETGNTFFLGIDIAETPTLKIPILKWHLYKIKLIVNNEIIAVSLPVTAEENNFIQEFTPEPTANFESLLLSQNTQQPIVEICYKTIAGLTITHQYTAKNIIASEISNTDTTNNNNQQAQTCTCEPINTQSK